MSRPISLADLTQLKAATHDLVKAVSGLDRAAEIAGVSKSQVRRWYAERDESDPSQPSWTTIDSLSIAVLEADLAERGNPRRPVTECLARLGGRALSDAAGGVARASIAAAAATLFGLVGDLTADLALSLADGVVTPTEGASGDAKARAVMAALVDLRQALTAARAPEDR